MMGIGISEAIIFFAMMVSTILPILVLIAILVLLVRIAKGVEFLVEDAKGPDREKGR